MTVPAELSTIVPDVAALASLLDGTGYLADDGLATAMFCALRLGQPILLEGEAGVGKTSAAKSLAAALGTPLIRLQCYEGIDIAEAAYEWNYPRQLLAIRLAEAEGDALGADDLFRRDYLVERPLLRAVEHPGPLPAVLLIDEIDRADEHFEAFLLELLAERSITVPEIGTITARVPPIAILTSNRTRDLHDALKRRCLYHWIDHPRVDQVVAIVRQRVPGATEALAVAGIGGDRPAAHPRPAEVAGDGRGHRLGAGAPCPRTAGPRRSSRRDDDRLCAEVSGGSRPGAGGRPGLGRR